MKADLSLKGPEGRFRRPRSYRSHGSPGRVYLSPCLMSSALASSRLADNVYGTQRRSKATTSDAFAPSSLDTGSVRPSSFFGVTLATRSGQKRVRAERYHASRPS